MPVTADLSRTPTTLTNVFVATTKLRLVSQSSFPSIDAGQSEEDNSTLRVELVKDEDVQGNVELSEGKSS